MKLKKLMTILSGAMLLVSFNNVVAANATCPTPDKIRALGSKFSYAYNVVDYNWILVSDTFSWKDAGWQTIFELSLPGVVDPAMAISMGQEYFNKSPLSTQPLSQTYGDKTECNYSPAKANYKVQAVTPVAYGIMKH